MSVTKSKIILRTIILDDCGDVLDCFADSTQYHPFVSCPWLRFVADSFNGRLYLLLAEKGDEALAYLPVWEVRRRFFGKAAEVPPVTAYWNPVFAPAGDSESNRRAVSKLFADDIARRYKKAYVLMHPEQWDVRQYLWAGWSSIPRYTTSISFDDPETHLASFSSKLRNKIKQCEGMEVASSDDPEPFYGLYDYTFDRQDMELPVLPEHIRDISEAFSDTCRFYYLLDAGGDAVAGRFEIFFRDVSYDLLAATGPEGRGPRGAYLLWKTLCDVTAKGYRMDMLGINFPTFATFKESFGGETVPYHLLKYDRNLLTRIVYGLSRGYHR
ncbi:MAG: GNAT family N-acetyltransferase [bacterium]|nr:GNAT family N-acetyltransferase [bacterium]